MARLYANENFPREVVEALRRLGHEVTTAQEAGRANQGIPDEEVLRYASEQGRVLFTLNRRYFVRLHIREQGHSGMIVCTQDTDSEGRAERIHVVLESTPDLTGQLFRVNRPAN